MHQLKLFVRDVAAGVFHHTGFARARAKSVATIVTFHRVLTPQQIAEYPLPGLAVTVEEFDWCLRYFDSYYTCNTVDNILTRYKGGERPDKPFLAVSFDDGQKDNFDNALPVLQRYGIKASFFVVLDAISNNTSLWHDSFAYRIRNLQQTNPGKLKEFVEIFLPELVDPGSQNDVEFHNSAIQLTKSMKNDLRLDMEQYLLQDGEQSGRPKWDGIMSWDHLENLLEDGHEIGSHTYSHPILPNCDPEQIEREVKGSRDELARRLANPISTFCYPNGSYDDGVVAAVKGAGYRHGITTKWGLNSAAENPLLLKRCDIQSNTSRARSGELSYARLALRMSDLQPGL